MNTKNYALAWELGFGTSYTSFMRLLACEIQSLGHTCTVFTKDLALARRLFRGLSVEMRPAPVMPVSGGHPSFVQTSYASLMFSNGFSDPEELSVRVEQWISLYSEHRIDIVLARHSPAAILAAQIMGLPIIHYGNGFSIPPPLTPWPSFRPDLRVDERVLRANEQITLRNVNLVRLRWGCEQIADLGALYSALDTLLLDYPELDSWSGFRTRRGAKVEYLGFPDINFGQAPNWPGKRRIKVFLSLLETSDLQWVREVIEAGAEVIVRVRGGTLGVDASHGSAFATILGPEPLNFAKAISECDCVIGYGSHNLVCEALLQGKPVAVIRHSADELLLGQRVEMLGAGISMGSAPQADTRYKLRKFWADSRYAEAAQRFRNTYEGQNRGAIAAHLVRLSQSALAEASTAQ